MTKRCIVMFSGGLDSSLCVRIMQEQGVDVVALTVRMMFECCDKAEEVAREFGVPLVFVEQGDDYFDLLRHPKFGFGRGVNPCVDCRIYLLEQAVKKIEEVPGVRAGAAPDRLRSFVNLKRIFFVGEGLDQVEPLSQHVCTFFCRLIHRASSLARVGFGSFLPSSGIGLLGGPVGVVGMNIFEMAS